MSGYRLLRTSEEIQVGPFRFNSSFDDSDSDERSTGEERHETTPAIRVKKDRIVNCRRGSFEETRLIDSGGSASSYTHAGPRNDKDKDMTFPSKVFFIIGSEFCERFCFYGLSTILVLYLSSELHMTESSATFVFHLWTALAYFMPLFGAILADSFIGKYRTILYLSVVYLVGSTVLSVATIKPLVPTLSGEKTLALLGLGLIAFGTGGIKPCVSAFGGDQFKLPQQEMMITKFYTIFYFSINAGSLISTILTPILREDVSCFGGNCFPLAFGVPALLMFVALVVFVIGTPYYTIIPPEGNILGDVVRCTLCAGCRRIRRMWSPFKPSSSGDENKAKRSSHWLHLAADEFSWSLINDVKVLYRVLFLFLPLPFFWALYGQQGSRWTFQASKMMGSVGSWTIKPDQMQVLNPILLLTMIPIFNCVVYPFLTRFGVFKSPLRRMFVGGLFGSLAFVASGLIQVAIENSPPGYAAASDDGVNVMVMNILPCPIDLDVASSGFSKSVPAQDLSLLTYDTKELRSLLTNSSSLTIRVKAFGHSSQCKLLSGNTITKDIHVHKEQKEILVAVTFYLNGVAIVNLPDSITGARSKFQNRNETSQMRVVDSTDIMRLSPVYFRGNKQTMRIQSEIFSKGISYSSVFLPPEFTTFELLLPSLSQEGEAESTSLGWISNSPSSSSVLLIYKPTSASVPGASTKYKLFRTSKPSIHIFWQFPQYFLLAAGEVMFSITGLEFAFTQAPSSMKSVVQAAWLITTSVGNLLVAIVAGGFHLQKQSTEFFLFSGLLFVDMIIFFVMSRQYYRAQDEEAVEMRRFTTGNTSADT